MFQIDNATAAESPDAVPDAGTPGYFTAGNPSEATPATKVPAWFLNMLQAELMAVVVAGGLTASKTTLTQVRDAIAAMIAAADAALTLGDLSNVTLTSPTSGQALIWNGSAWVNGTPASAIDEIRKRLLLNDLRDAIGTGLLAELINAYPDPYADLAGINTGGASNYALDASGAFIHNESVTYSDIESGDWSGATGQYTLGAGTADCTGGNSALYTTATFTDDVIFTATLNNQTTPPVGGHNDRFSFALLKASDIGSFNATETGGFGGLRTADAWYVLLDWNAGNTIIYDQGTQVATYALPANGDDLVLRREDGVVTYEVEGSVVHTFAHESGAAAHLCIGSDNSYNDFTGLQSGVPATPGNLVLPSVLLEPLSVPTTGAFIGLVEPIDAVTYGTDLQVYMTRDDGDQWDELTLEQLGTTVISVGSVETEVDVLYGEVTLTGASETNGRYRWNVSNNKALRLHGAAPEFY